MTDRIIADLSYIGIDGTYHIHEDITFADQSTIDAYRTYLEERGAHNISFTVGELEL